MTPRPTIADRTPPPSRIAAALAPRDPAEPVAGWRDLGDWLAGRGPRPFPEPGQLRACPTCHGWHR